jgi:simple sugar transport system permease protein
MSKFNTLVMAGVSVLVIALGNGTQAVTNAYNSSTGFPSSAASIIIGIFLFFIVGCEFFINYQMKLRTGVSKEEN